MYCYCWDTRHGNDPCRLTTCADCRELKKQHRQLARYIHLMLYKQKICSDINLFRVDFKAISQNITIRISLLFQVEIADDVYAYLYFSVLPWIFIYIPNERHLAMMKHCFLFVMYICILFKKKCISGVGRVRARG